MSDDTTAPATQAVTDSTTLTPQAGDTTTTTPQAGESQSTTKTQKSAEDYERMIADLRKENASHRTRLNKFEEEAKKQAEAQLSKEQLLEKQLAELTTQREQELQERFVQTARQEAAIEAAKLGVDPAYLDKVFRFLEWDEIEADESGKPANVRELMEQLVKEMPALRGRTAPTSGGATNPARSQSTAPQALSWQVIGNMKPDEYQARRAEIQQWIAEHPYKYGSQRH